MKYYKLGKDVYAFEKDGSQDEYIKPGSIRMTDNEVKVHFSDDSTLVYDKKTDSILRDPDLVKSKRNEEIDQVWGDIKRYRNDKMEGGVYLEKVGYHFQTDNRSKTEYTRLSMLVVIGDFKPVQWKTVENEFIEITSEVLKELLVSITKFNEYHMSRAEYHKLMLSKTEYPLTYDFKSQW